MEFKVHLPSPQLIPHIQCNMDSGGSNDRVINNNTLFPSDLSSIFFNVGDTGKIAWTTNIYAPSVSMFGQIDRSDLPRCNDFAFLP